MDAERALHDTDLHEEDWAALVDHIARLFGKAKHGVCWQAASDIDTGIA